MTVPMFGDWDMKNGAMPDYSMDFSKIREMHTEIKKEFSRASLSGEDDLLAHHNKSLEVTQPSAEQNRGSSFGCCLSCSLNLT
ncbi:hypothetical protein ZWY2020_020795 [Hordeum vulgare]|nr:hypothetical protein ZWY2020_020795 [Hordeum vulgare]